MTTYARLTKKESSTANMKNPSKFPIKKVPRFGGSQSFGERIPGLWTPNSFLWFSWSFSLKCSHQDKELSVHQASIIYGLHLQTKETNLQKLNQRTTYAQKHTPPYSKYRTEKCFCCCWSKSMMQHFWKYRNSGAINLELENIIAAKEKIRDGSWSSQWSESREQHHAKI